MLDNTNKDGRSDFGSEEPEQTNPQGEFSADMSKRIPADIISETASIRDTEDKALQEKGRISVRQFYEASNRIFRFLIQSKQGFWVEDFRRLILLRDRINVFIEHTEWANGEEDEVEKKLVRFEEEGMDERLKIPESFTYG